MKLKLLTVIFIVLYIANLCVHFKDFQQGYNETECHDDKAYTTLVVKQTPSDTSDLHLSLTDKKTTDIQIREIKETIEVEVPKQHLNGISNFFIGLLGILTILLSPVIIVVFIKFFKNLYNGNIVSNSQIRRLQILAYFQLLLPVLGNIFIYYSNKEQQEVANIYNLDLAKYDYDFSLFIIPLILLLIVEVLKQHLTLKENAELTI
ncbi:DUF2975 domain-containing protein [Myroides sp. M-43]|uniref:DUF2975 domain-containing protein n=1 Tax=Myroides oncorhynchi TaxID=2893756 RepID=UPI001E477105|nr:DUF2975 domain-containing protein [Myroides oncorhynchi]MCC9041674.1 DUF2975 domain-containing protein [Myroides oncorhynchi]